MLSSKMGGTCFNVQVVTQCAGGKRNSGLNFNFFLAVIFFFFLVAGCKSERENGTGTGQTDWS